MDKLTPEQFKELLNDKFFHWASRRPRSLDAWICSLEEWIALDPAKRNGS
ncbi:MAG TPA: hypothetical protein VJ742_12535 [Nitrososphaera sp.]|nr:hypothetical protein [Nitrososphaera sp.]